MRINIEIEVSENEVVTYVIRTKNYWWSNWKLIGKTKDINEVALIVKRRVPAMMDANYETPTMF